MDSIIVENLYHTYYNKQRKPVPILRDISFEWKKGENLALMGESGSGKSTLARLLIGLEKPASGHISINGEYTGEWGFSTWRIYRSHIQAVFQDASGTLNPCLSVKRNMEEALINLTRNSAEKRMAIINELMECMGLDKNLLKLRVDFLSGGEQRRISLVRSLSVHPDYLILDEVTSGLDLISADSVLTTLERYRDRFGCSYLFITHDENHALRLSDRALVIKEGKLEKEAQKTRRKDT